MKVDFPSLLMVVSFTANLIVCILDPTKLPFSRDTGIALLVLGSLLFIYVLPYLRTGLFGETKPDLDYLITKGPYRICRHPLYLSFIVIVLGIDFMLRSVLGVAFTFLLAVPSAIYRARIEDGLLRDKFGEEWVRYANGVGFILPKVRDTKKR